MSLTASWLPLRRCSIFTLLSQVFPRKLRNVKQTETEYLLWNDNEEKWHKWSLRSSKFYLTAQHWWTESKWMHEWGVVGPGELWPPARGQSLHHCSHRGVEVSGMVGASDDRARRIVTRTTRKDKPDGEKREMREEEEEERWTDREKKRRWKQIRA